ncbi:hypothetical protein XacyCFBP2565_06940 [Xanthomonas arboricola pv. corylina]|uniref:hypothetical protein n=1 Tax=Xanthomonas arboricola TaxID=56448 RepID=UPI000CED92A5|nr:hypothetical protein [Xanthomonas arboricola]PPU15553.1 hypothetical protein XacyCFBP2565_06940 [Xanthomonas arboricola pv. corylina]
MKAYPARVREWLKANPGAHSPRVILDGMDIAQGAENRRPYYSAIKDNADAGYLERVGSGPRPAYAFVCDPPPHEGESLSRVEKHRAYMRQRHLDNGGRTMAERRQDEALQKAARAERLAREKAERLAVRQAAREAKQQARLSAKAKPVRSPKGYTVIPIRASVLRRPVAARPSVQTVEDWIRAGGQVTRLPGVEQYIPDRCRA